ncbi:MAG: DUF4174 domain-containing protein [Marinirhabdus sp.]|nr:DUF4174 domain-containing protein [Marinirhabdus sp.]
MKFTILLILSVCIYTNTMEAQDLKKHQWEHRIIVVSSSTFENQEAKEQLQLLKKDTGALDERKLVIYHVTNSGYTVDFSEDIQVSEKTQFAIESFQVSLIGLDGTEKFHATEVQPAAKFFTLIDAMPMRRAEMKNDH